METIEIDCAPGTPRPDTYIAGLLEGTGLAVPEAPVSTFFGCWTYAFDVPRHQWETWIQPVVRPRIEALYHSGAIRFGSW
jgi:hypothetical protein